MRSILLALVVGLTSAIGSADAMEHPAGKWRSNPKSPQGALVVEFYDDGTVLVFTEVDGVAKQSLLFTVRATDKPNSFVFVRGNETFAAFDIKSDKLAIVRVGDKDDAVRMEREKAAE